MPSTTTQANDDVTQVRDLLISLISEGRGDEAVDAALSMMEQLRSQNTELQLKLMQLRQARAGKRSERLDPEQLSLLLQLSGEDDDVEEELIEDIAGEIEDEQPRERRKPRRKRPPESLPREVIEHDVPESELTCPGCQGALSRIGEDVSEVLELEPARFVVQQHRRAKYACPRCKDGVVTAPGPAKLLDGGLAGPSLLAHVVQSKYDDHVPLTRLCRIYGRGGVELSSSTLSDWVAAVANEVTPLVAQIRERVLASHVVQTDGSGLKVLERDHPDGVRRGTMWCLVGDRRWSVFEYSQTGSGEDGPWRFLQGREGYVQADAASVFDRLYDGQAASAVEVGCWAHARRKFHALKDSDARVAYPLQLISKLYRVESVADSRELDAEGRAELRRDKSSRILERLRRWLTKTAAREPPAGALAKACAYSLNHWDALSRFLEDGHLAPDNNLCELQITKLGCGA